MHNHLISFPFHLFSNTILFCHLFSLYLSLSFLPLRDRIPLKYMSFNNQHFFSSFSYSLAMTCTVSCNDLYGLLSFRCPLCYTHCFCCRGFVGAKHRAWWQAAWEVWTGAKPGTQRGCLPGRRGLHERRCRLPCLITVHIIEETVGESGSDGVTSCGLLRAIRSSPVVF